MIPDNDVIYTDGHNVTVTESTLKVKNTMYRIDGIIKHGLLRLRAQRAPGIIMVVLGVIIALCGIMRLFTPSVTPDVQLGDTYTGANALAIWIGAALFIVGILILAFVRDRYAVRIATAEGEKNAVVSYKKEYVAQIVDALNVAYNKIRYPHDTYTAR